MGKATILENLGNGRYTIEIDVGQAEKEAKLFVLNSDRIALETLSFEIYNKLTEAGSNLDVAVERHRVAGVEIEFFYVFRDNQIQTLRSDLISLENEFDTEKNEEYTYNLNYNNAVFLLNGFKDELNVLTVLKDTYAPIVKTYIERIEELNQRLSKRSIDLQNIDENIIEFENISSNVNEQLEIKLEENADLSNDLESSVNDLLIPNSIPPLGYLNGQQLLNLLSETQLFKTIKTEQILNDLSESKAQAEVILKDYYENRLSGLGFISNVSRTLLSQLSPSSSTSSVNGVASLILTDINTRNYNIVSNGINDQELLQELQNLRDNGLTISDSAFDALVNSVAATSGLRVSIVSTLMTQMASVKTQLLKDVYNYVYIGEISDALIQSAFDKASENKTITDLVKASPEIRDIIIKLDVINTNIKDLEANRKIVENSINDLEQEIKQVRLLKEDNEYQINKLEGRGATYIDGIVASIDNENAILNTRIGSINQNIELLQGDPSNALEISLLNKEKSALLGSITANSNRKTFYLGLKPGLTNFITIPIKKEEIAGQNIIVRDRKRELVAQQKVVQEVQNNITKKMEEINKKEFETPPKGMLNELASAEAQLIEASAKYDSLNTEYKIIKLKISNISKLITQIGQIPGKVVKNAWCADYSTEATGLVATLEIPDEPQLTIIKPGAPSPTSLDGRILARQFMDPNQLYLNAAILPGVQKFRPKYRKGIISYKHGTGKDDKVNVTLDETRMGSLDNPIDINVSNELVGVSVEYMDVGASIFEVNDRCVVEFSNREWSNPKVIGFVDNPKDGGKVPFLLVWANHPSPLHNYYFIMLDVANPPIVLYTPLENIQNIVIGDTFKVNPNYQTYYPFAPPPLFQINFDQPPVEIYFLYIWSNKQSDIDAAKAIVENGIAHFHGPDKRHYVDVRSLDRNLFPKPTPGKVTRLTLVPSAYLAQSQAISLANPRSDLYITYGFLGESYSANPQTLENSFRTIKFNYVNEWWILWNYLPFGPPWNQAPNFMPFYDIHSRNITWGPLNQHTYTPIILPENNNNEYAGFVPPS